MFDIRKSVWHVPRPELAEYLKSKHPLTDSKEELVEKLLKRYDRYPDTTRRKFIKAFPSETGVTVRELDEEYGIKRPERQRLTKEGKLPIVGYYDSKASNGYLIKVPLYDRLFVEEKLEKLLPVWRQEYKKQVTKNRKSGWRKSRETRELMKSVKKDLQEGMAKSREEWLNISPIFAATMELAYWSKWMDKWINEYYRRASSPRRRRNFFKGSSLSSQRYKALWLFCASPCAAVSFCPSSSFGYSSYYRVEIPVKEEKLLLYFLYTGYEEDAPDPETLPVAQYEEEVAAALTSNEPMPKNEQKIYTVDDIEEKHCQAYLALEELLESERD